MVIPAICVDRESELSIVDCEVKGNDIKQTIGVLSRLGVLHIRNTVISGHKEGGVMIWGNRDNPSKLIKNKI